MNGTTVRQSPGRKGTPEAESKSKLPRTVAEVLKEHVELELECIDRMYLNVFVPRLQIVEGALRFIRQQLRSKVLSTTAVEPMTRGFVRSIEQFAQDNEIPVVNFEKGQRKDDIAAERRSQFQKSEGVVFIGKAQEKCRVFRTEKRHNPKNNKTYAWIVKSTAMVNQYYFYCIDSDFGPFFIKFSSYFPYNAKLCLNGHEYVKRQLERQGIAFQALDNGVLSCQNSKKLQEISDNLSATKIDRLLRKWLRRLPYPFAPKHRKAGYLYQISILQIELSRTQVLDCPVSGRIFFEEVIRENLDIGRPKQVQLIFDRWVTKSTPGSFRTRVITDGVIPSLHIDYKGTRIKQYHKEGHALRTETTINNTRDFYIGKSLKNLPTLCQIGFQANRRLLEIQTISQDCILAEETFQQLNHPRILDDQRVSALRFADKTVHALWNALLTFDLLPAGFSNRQLRHNLAGLLGHPLHYFTQGRMTYQLRRLRLHGLIARIPKTHRYRLTSFGLRVSLFCTRTYNRILRPGIGKLVDITNASVPDALRRSFDNVELQIQNWIQRQRLSPA